MKVVILAAGYGTRLARDLNAASGQYPHLLGVAKPLLPIAGKPLISHWMDILGACEEQAVGEVYVVVRLSSKEKSSPPAVKQSLRENSTGVVAIQSPYAWV